MKIFSTQNRNIITLVSTTYLLILIGLILIYNASAVTSLRDFGDQSYLLKKQAVSVLLGTVSLFFLSFINYRILINFSKVFYFGSLALLAALYIPGVADSIYGAKRWITIAGQQFQPSEAAKLSVIIYLSQWLGSSKIPRKLYFQSQHANLALVLGPILGLIFFEPDLKSTIIIAATAMTIYYVSGAVKARLLFSLIPLFLVSVMLLIFTQSYRIDRLKTFIDPTADTQNTSYHINQILIALGNGGWFGVGLGQSRQKFEFIPEITTDSIFAIAAEELGFVGALTIIGVLWFLLINCFAVAGSAKDNVARLLAVGITTSLALQIIINLASMVSLLPLTGIPLPFLSYGGTSLIMAMSSIGILINISKNQTEPRVNIYRSRKRKWKK